MRKITMVAILVSVAFCVLAQTRRKLNVPFSTEKNKIVVKNIQSPDLGINVLSHPSSYIITEKDSIDIFVFSVKQSQSVKVTTKKIGESLNANYKESQDVTLTSLNSVLAKYSIGPDDLSSSSGKNKTLSIKTYNDKQKALIQTIQKLNLSQYVKAESIEKTKTLATSSNNSFSAFAQIITVPIEAVKAGTTTFSITANNKVMDITAGANDNITVISAPLSVFSKLRYNTVLMTQRDTLDYVCSTSTFTNQEVGVKLLSITDGARAYLSIDNKLKELTNLTATQLNTALSGQILFENSKLGTVNYSLIFVNNQGTEIPINGSYQVSNSDYLVYATQVAPTYIAQTDKVQGYDNAYPFNEVQYNLTYTSKNNNNQKFYIKKIVFGANGSEKDYVTIGGTKYTNANKTEIQLNKEIALPSAFVWYNENAGEQNLKVTFANQDGTEYVVEKVVKVVNSAAPMLTLENDLAANQTEVSMQKTNPYNFPTILISAIKDNNPSAKFSIKIGSNKAFNAVSDFDWSASSNSFKYKPLLEITNDGIHSITINLTRNDGKTFVTTYPIQFNWVDWYVSEAKFISPALTNDDLVMDSGNSAVLQFKIVKGANTNYNFQLALAQTKNKDVTNLFSANPFFVTPFPWDKVLGGESLTPKSLNNAKLISDNGTEATYQVTVSATNATSIQQVATLDFWVVSRFDDISTSFTKALQTSYPSGSNLKLPYIAIDPIMCTFEQGYPVTAQNVWSTNNISVKLKIKNPASNKNYVYQILSDNVGVVSSTAWTDVYAPSSELGVNLPTYQGQVGSANLSVRIAVKGNESNYTQAILPVTVTDDKFNLNVQLVQYYKGDAAQAVKIQDNVAAVTANPANAHNQLSIRVRLGANLKKIPDGSKNLKVLSITSSSGDIIVPNDAFSSLDAKIAHIEILTLTLHKGTTAAGWVKVTAINENGYICTETLNYTGLKNPELPVFSFVMNNGSLSLGNPITHLLRGDCVTDQTIIDYFKNKGVKISSALIGIQLRYDSNKYDNVVDNLISWGSFNDYLGSYYGEWGKNSMNYKYGDTNYYNYNLNDAKNFNCNNAECSTISNQIKSKPLNSSLTLAKYGAARLPKTYNTYPTFTSDCMYLTKDGLSRQYTNICYKWWCEDFYNSIIIPLENNQGLSDDQKLFENPNQWEIVGSNKLASTTNYRDITAGGIKGTVAWE